MRPSRGRFELVKAALRNGMAGAGLGTFWMLIGSIHAGRPSTQVAFLVVVGGFVGGLVWFLTGKLPVRGRWWYYARCALIGMTAFLLIVLTDLHDATPQVVLIPLPLAAAAGALVGWYYKDYRPPGSTKK